MSRVVASLLATVFGDIETLGTERLLSHHPARGPEEFELAELAEITSLRFPDCVHPWMHDELGRALAHAAGSFLGVLRNHTSCSTGASDHFADERFPCNVFRKDKPSTQRTLGFAVADGHLHSGASMPMPVFFDYLAARGQPIDLALAPRTVTSFGRRIRLGPLLAGLRTSLRLMWCVWTQGSLDADLLSAHGFDDRVAKALDGERYWLLIRDEALGFGGPPDDQGDHDPVGDDYDRVGEVYDRGGVVGEAYDGVGLVGESVPSSAPTDIEADGSEPPGHWVNAGYMEHDRLPCVADLLWRFVDVAPLGPERSMRFAEDTVRALFAVESALRARPGEGLSRFAERFRFLGAAWRSTGAAGAADEAKARIVQRALRANASSAEVVGAEFRKTIRASEVGEFQNEVEAALAIHATAFRNHLADETPMALCMPVGFQRKAQRNRLAATAGIDELQHVVSGCEALRRIAYPAVGDGKAVIGAIRAFDVAGDELGSANWPFMVGAQVLQLLGLELVYTIHAGESFVSRINGVRRVAELFQPEVQPARVGHALALSPEAADGILRFGSPNVNRWEAIMDLAWLAASGLDSGSALDALHRITAPDRHLPRVDADVWVQAVKSLTSLDELCQVLLHKDPDSHIYTVRRPDELLDSATGSDKHRAMSGLAWGADSTVCGVDLGASLEGDLLREYQAVDEALAAPAREYARELVVASGAAIESCPTSNVVLAGLGDYGQHPLWDFQNSMRVTVSSDDPAIFGCTIVDEFSRLLDTGRDPQVVARLAETSVGLCAGGPPGPEPCRDRHERALAALAERASRDEA